MLALLRVDVAICTYNRARLLDRTLDVLQRQVTAEDVEWQVLVVDNNCTDDTVATVERHKNAGLRVTVVHESRQGLTPARRRAVEATSAPWIAFVDDDCLLAPDWVEEVGHFARDHPDCGAFGSRVLLEWEREPPDYVLRFPWAYAAQDYGPEPRRVGCLAGAGMVVRREALHSCGWINEQLLSDRTGNRLDSGGDVELALRVGARHDLWYAPSCTLRHVITPDRASFAYLRRLTFALGKSKFFGDSMLWPGSYNAWVWRSVAVAGALVRRAAVDAMLAIRGRRRVADVLLRLGFLAGWAAGAWDLARKPPSQRNTFLGLAQVARH
jgi:glycosyltransferase involved in cell wall biosynthesis